MDGKPSFLFQGIRYMKKNLKISMLVFMLSFFLLSPALAIYVDFTNFALSGNIVGSPYTDNLSGSITITFENVSGNYLWWDNKDGFGIYDPGYENDEIESPEKMRISFSTAVYVDYFDLTDLFYEGSPGYEYEEIGWYNFNGEFDTSKIVFSQTDHLKKPWPTSNGEYRLDINQIISEIWFSSPGIENCFKNHEFSVAGVEVSPIPEPATMLLLGSGLIGLAGIGRRKFNKIAGKLF
jgi:hypothetical protein